MPLLRYALPFCVYVLTSVFPQLSVAEITTLTIPDQGWAITFDAPPLRPVREADSNDHYMYYGNANFFSVVINVDTPACDGGDSHENVLNCFWPKASKEPLINQASVQKSCNSNYCKLSYELENSFQDKSIKQRHVYFLFAYRNKWNNVHISFVNPTEVDLKVLEKFEQSISYK